MEVTDRSLEAFRELAAAGIVEPVFRFNRAGWEHREEWINACADALHP